MEEEHEIKHSEESKHSEHASGHKHTAELSGSHSKKCGSECKNHCTTNILIATSVINIMLLLVISFQLAAINNALDTSGNLAADGTGIKITGENNAGQNGQGQQANQAQQPTNPTNGKTDMAALMDDDAVKGSSDATVTIVEFSDYQCPFCVRFYKETLGQIDDQYIKTGKVKMIYRDFPLGIHQYAQKAAEAAECAGEQNKYFEMHNKLFDKGVDGGVAAYKKYAGELGLNQGDFDSCIDSGQMAEEVAKDMQDGQRAGITGTPGFFINGKLVKGAQPFSVFKTEIDAALNG